MTELLSFSSFQIPFAIIVTAFNAIQGDSGGNVKIVGGDSTHHTEKISTNEHVTDSECLPRQSCLNLQIQGDS